MAPVTMQTGATMDERQWAERLVRYQYLETLVAKRRVLELGCGQGRGTALLARCAAQVVGVDIATPALEQAWRGQSGANLSFASGDGGALQQPDHSFDLVIVPELQRWIARGSLLAELQRVLRPGGLAAFIVASADAGRAPGLGYSDLVDFLEQSFEYVRVLGEIPFIGRTMADFAPEGDVEAALDCSLIEEDEPPSHYLALCSDHALPSLPYTVLQLPWGGWDEEPTWLRDQLGRVRQERDRALQRADARQRELQALEARLADDGRQHAELRRAHAERDDLREQLEQLRRFQLQTAAGAGRERPRVEEERGRGEPLQARLGELHTQLEQQQRRADEAEQARTRLLSELESLRRRAERAEQRCDALVGHVEQGAAEATRLQQRVAELQALRQNDQWRVDELQGRVAEAEARLAARPATLAAPAPSPIPGAGIAAAQPAAPGEDRGQLQTLLEGAARHQQEAERWRAQRAELEAVSTALHAERDTLAQRLERCQAQVKSAEERAERHRRELGELARRLARAEGELKRAAAGR